MARKKKTIAIAPTVDDRPPPTTYITQSAPLLSLPDELRNRIFGLVCSQITLQYSCRTGTVPRNQRKRRVGREFFDGRPRTPGFVLVCKQLHYESIQVLYAEATFAFDTLLGMRSWLNAVCDQNLGHVKNIVMTSTRPLYGDRIGLHIAEGALVKEKKTRPTWAFIGGSWCKAAGGGKLVFDTDEGRL